MYTSVTYGIIKNNDLESSESQLLSFIKSKNEYNILSVKRLNRRDSKSDGIPTETVRICTKGSSRLQYIKMINIRVKVEAFVFSVSQCSQSWRFGHPLSFFLF